MKKIIFPLFLLVVFTILKISFSSFSTGVSGATGCGCHGPDNAATLITMSGFPSNYANGQSYPIMLTIANPTKLAGGFTLIVSDGVISNNQTNITSLGSPTELHHTSPQPFSLGSASWTFTWTAPTTGSTPVTVNVAGNAVNLANQNSGDEPNIASLTVAGPSILLSTSGVHLLSFKGLDNKASQIITWKVATENEVDRYEVEHSNDGIHFSSIAMVKTEKAQRNGKGELEYTITNDNIVDGFNYYRLVVKSMNGTRNVIGELIKVKHASNNAFSNLNIFPNPIQNSSLEFDLTAPHKESAVILVYDMFGNKFRELKLYFEEGENHKVVNLENAPSGKYWLKIMPEKQGQPMVKAFMVR